MILNAVGSAQTLKGLYGKVFVFLPFLCFVIVTQLLISQDIQESVFKLQENPHLAISNLSLEEQRQLTFLIKCKNNPLTMESIKSKDYWLLKNVIRGKWSAALDCWESITYATIGDFTAMRHLAQVVKCWMGPVSFALFAPGYDFDDTMDAIQYVRHCLPESSLIRDYVSFHIFFPRTDLPYAAIPTSEFEALSWPYDCEDMDAFYEHTKRESMYTTRVNLSFPIMEARNIAREAANTHFVLDSDIEYYPSLGFIDEYLHMIANNRNSFRKFPLPIIEVKSNDIVSDRKDKLVAMLKIKTAIHFQPKVCEPWSFTDVEK